VSWGVATPAGCAFIAKGAHIDFLDGSSRDYLFDRGEFSRIFTGAMIATYNDNLIIHRNNVHAFVEAPEVAEALRGSLRTVGSASLWVLVLAGGEGRRLSSLTTALHGDPTPKQFATLIGTQSMLQMTLLRARALVPWQRIVVVATEPYGAVAEEQTRALGAAHVLVQPTNRGTLPALLLPLTYIRRVDPKATVLVLPSDHFVAEPQIFENALVGLAAAARTEDRIALLGVEPDWPVSDYGWIVPGPAFTSRPAILREVVRFMEKPPSAIAAELMRAGGLWNTFVFAATLERLWEEIESSFTHHANRFTAFAKHIGTGNEPDRFNGLYARLPAADFSRGVLSEARDLAVATAPACGWSDWGTPDRVFESLAATPELEQLERRLQGKVIPFGLSS
jgi:mannose-1-phosphate guanylyltransferase